LVTLTDATNKTTAYGHDGLGRRISQSERARTNTLAEVTRRIGRQQRVAHGEGVAVGRLTGIHTGGDDGSGRNMPRLSSILTWQRQVAGTDRRSG
jgi:YD repeat-containing protein